MQEEAAVGLQALDPEAYLLEHLHRGVREDGRSLASLPPVLTQIGLLSPSPSALVLLGRTTVVCAVKYLVGTPSINSADRGDVLFDVSVAKEKTEQHRKNALELQIESLLYKLLYSGALIDLKLLCIEEGRAAYRLDLAVNCLLDDGQTVDAALLACVLALRSTPIPTAVEDPQRRVYAMKPIVSVTAAVFDEIIVLHPSNSELALAHAAVQCVFDASGALCFFHCDQRRGHTLSVDMHRKVTAACLARCKGIREDVFQT